MMQKVAAMVNKVAADLGFRAYEVRWLLKRKIFAIAATSAADLLLDDNINNIASESYAKRSFDRREIRTSSGAQGTSLYIIGVLNTQRFGAFVPKIGECGGRMVYTTRGSICITRASRVSVFFEKKFSSNEDCAKE